MFKPFAFASAIALAGTPVMAEGLSGVYVNPEYNAGFSGSSFAGSSLELHAGYETGPWYVQAGPALSNDGSDSEWGFSAKSGLSASVTDNADLYTEVSYAKFKDTDAGYGVKLGAKYMF
jgi:outer membrane autotransporter protein|tara:strand:- start:75 stop:431 length:357 start_codon:yes stop_codon:yes gene_type:complete